MKNFINTSEIFLFYANGARIGTWVAPIRFYKAKLSAGKKDLTTLLFDLYPCRIGNAGYVYDKISDTILGDGSLTPGPDSTKPKPNR